MQTDPMAPGTEKTAPARLRGWLATFVPMPIPAGARERIKSCLGALIGLVCTEWISRHLLGGFNPWFVAPMGASAVLLFAVPASPLAQPWSIIGGNVVAALVGVTCAKWIPDPGLAAAIAVAVAIVLMFQLHCIHPPSGAVAITAVFGGPAIAKLGYGFVVFPVALNSMLLLLLALSFNNLVRRRYPHRPASHGNTHGTRDPLPGERVGFTGADLDQVLAARGEFLDIDKDDLEQILVAAELRAYRRRFGDVLCGDIMSRDIVAIEADERLSVAWKLLTQHRLQVLPVVSRRHGRLVGLITLHDLFVARRGLPAPRQDGIVRDLMLTNVAVARAEQPMVELAHILSDGGLHQLPVVDDQRKLIGLVTQSDLIAALVKSRLILKDV